MTDIKGSTYPIQSGSDQHFSLTKKVISNESAKDKLNSLFSEVIISDENFDSEKIKGIYNDLFYQTPKKGKKSHTSIIEQSNDYIHPEININLEDKITSLSDELLELNEKYLKETLPQSITQHPIYDNGIMIQNGDTQDNKPIDPKSDIWYMQEGFKRKLGKNSSGNTNGYWPRLLRQAQKEDIYEPDGSMRPLYDSPNFRFLSTEELNEIPNGEDIDSGDDLNLIKITDQGPQYIYDEIDITLECIGKESFYKFKSGDPGYNYDLSDYQYGGDIGGYWWLDTEGSCKVKIERDTDPTTTFTSISEWKTISAGKSLRLKISRDKKFYGHPLNGTDDPLDFNFYQGGNKVSTQREQLGQLLPPLWSWKHWGEGTILPSIIDIEPGSRLTYRIHSPYNSNGQVVDGGGSHNLNATIVGEGPDGSAQQQGYPWQEGLFNSIYQKTSKYSTRQINQKCYGPFKDNCYGALGQKDVLQDYLDKEDNGYYLDNVNGDKKFTNIFVFPWPFNDLIYGHHTVNGRVYGQPILKVKGNYCVFLESYRVRTAGVFHYDYNVFMRLKDRHIFRIINKDLDNYVEGYKRDHNDLFNWLAKKESPFINNPTIYFPGLKGYSINYENTDLDDNTNLEGFDQIFTAVKLFINDILNSINSSGILPNGFNFNFIGNQLKDNPFNPKSGGSNYKWNLKSITKTS